MTRIKLIDAYFFTIKKDKSVKISLIRVICVPITYYPYQIDLFSNNSIKVLFKFSMASSIFQLSRLRGST